jgi:transcriptional regulator with XRE-family HTH domain
MTIGEKLKALRIQKGLTQEELIQALVRKFKVNWTREMWAKWESDGNPVSLEFAKVIVKYFDITLDELAFENKPVAKLANHKNRKNRGLIVT